MPEEVRDQMTFHLAESVEEVLRPVLGIGADRSVADGSSGSGADGGLSQVA